MRVIGDDEAIVSSVLDIVVDHRSFIGGGHLRQGLHFQVGLVKLLLNELANLG